MSATEVVFQYGDYTVRHWAAEDREEVAEIVGLCLGQYGAQFEPNGADRDAIEVEDFYLREEQGEFWVVVDRNRKLVGCGAYCEVGASDNSEKAVEIRKIYLLPEARGKKLGRAMLEVSGQILSFPSHAQKFFCIIWTKKKRPITMHKPYTYTGI